MTVTPDHSDLIVAIRGLPDATEAAVAGLHDQQLDTPYGEGKWTLRQVVHHLADSNLNGFSRTKLIISENEPVLPAYDQTVWAHLADSQRFPVSSSLIILKGVHERWGALLESLQSDQWTRCGIHSLNGPMTLHALIRTYVDNNQRHVLSITGFRAQRKW